MIEKQYPDEYVVNLRTERHLGPAMPALIHYAGIDYETMLPRAYVNDCRASHSSIRSISIGSLPYAAHNSYNQPAQKQKCSIFLGQIAVQKHFRAINRK